MNVPHEPPDSNLTRLDEWLASTSQVCLLVGPPGSGKTHLLEQWSAKSRGTEQWSVVVLFASRERGNWLARDWVPQLQLQLEQTGLDCSPPQNCNWRQLLYSIGYDLATDGFNDGKPTLLILGGLFESPSATELPEGVFGPTLAAGLKLLLTSDSDATALLASREDVVVIRQHEWDAAPLRIECERRGINTEAIRDLSRVHFRSAFEATTLLDALAQGLLELTPDHMTARAMWDQVFRRASRAGCELLSLLANCLAPLSHTDLAELVDDEHHIALKNDPLVALLTTNTARGAVLRNESLNAVVEDVVGLDWGRARLRERCGAWSEVSRSGYAFRYAAYHWTSAAGIEALLAFLDSPRQRKWQTNAPLYWQWADELRLVVRRLLEALVDGAQPECPVIGGLVRGVLQTATVYELSEAVVSGGSEQPEPIDDHDVLAVALAKLSRFATHPAAQEIAQWARGACKGRPATELEVALTLPAALRSVPLSESLRALIAVIDEGLEDGAFTVVLRATRALFEEEEDAALEMLRWAYEKHRDPEFADLWARQVAFLPTRAKRHLQEWMRHDNLQSSEFEAALLDSMDEELAGKTALRVLSARGHQSLSARSIGSAVRHLPEATLPQFVLEFAESPFAGDLATRFLFLGLWDAALELMSRTQSWREPVAAALVLGAPPEDPRCRDVLGALEPDELARILEGGNVGALFVKHGVTTVFAWAAELALSSRCLVALTRNAPERPPLWALEQLRQLAEGSKSSAELSNWLALGPWLREPEASAWVVEELDLDRARRYLAKLVGPLLESSGRRCVVDDDPHLDLIDLMPLIRRVGGESSVVHVAQALQAAWSAGEGQPSAEEA